MNSLIKDNKKKIIEWVFTLVSFIIVWILVIELFLGDSYPEYTSSLKNGYYIECIPGKGSKLKNDKFDYVYSENFPRKRITKTFQNDDFILILDEDEEYYIINLGQDSINGPYNRDQFLQVLKGMEYYDFLSWNYSY